MSVRTYDLSVPIKRAYNVLAFDTGITFENAMAPLTVTALSYTNNNQSITQVSDFVTMQPLTDQPGATGTYAVTVGSLPSFLNLDATTGIISYSSGTGETNFTFTVTFTPNGAYAGTVSFVVTAGIIVAPQFIFGRPVETWEENLTAAEIIASGPNPILVSSNPDPANLQYLCVVLRNSYLMDFNTTPYAATNGSNIDWSFFNESPSLTFVSFDFGASMDDSADRAIFSSSNYDFTETIVAPGSSAVAQDRGDLFLGTPPSISTDRRPINGDSPITARVEFVWLDLETLANF